jgi:hypothetical protein
VRRWRGRSATWWRPAGCRCSTVCAARSIPRRCCAPCPGIGRALARRIHDELGIGSLEELETAAHDGRLAGLAGFGTKRLGGVRDALAARLQRSRAVRAPAPEPEPPTAELLDVDREYRRRAERGELPTIAPRRFNPRHEAWLPILHATRGGRHYTALYSNTARAHQLGRTHDWVVLYCDGRGGERRYTVITAASGPAAGRRVVRGRESGPTADLAREDAARGAGRGSAGLGP